jgi:multidrug efflux system outer membrane protein
VLELRPDILAAEANLEAAAADVGTARADLFPQISLTGFFGWASLELDDLFTAPAETWSAAAALAQPLFEGGRRVTAVDRANALKQQRRAEYARTVQEAFGEVLDALQGQRNVGAIEETASERADALSRATELAELRYRGGEIAYLELLDVRRTSSSSRSTGSPRGAIRSPTRSTWRWPWAPASDAGGALARREKITS